MYIIKLEIDKNSDMVYELLELLKDNKLDDIQKNKVYELVKSLSNRTDNQKERFFRFYNLLEGENHNYRLCDMERYYNCSSGSIRFSVNRIRNGLINTNKENMAIIENILKEYHSKN